MRIQLAVCLVLAGCAGLVACGGVGDMRAWNLFGNMAADDPARIEPIGNEHLQWEKTPLPTVTDCTIAPTTAPCAPYMAR